MNAKNCKICGRIFNDYTGRKICQRCKDELEAKFSVVRDYVRDNKGVTVKQVSEECDVPEPQIRQWIKEERLEFDTSSGVGIACRLCGVAIPSGTYCPTCKAGLIGGLNNAGRQISGSSASQSQSGSSLGQGFFTRDNKRSF